MSDPYFFIDPSQVTGSKILLSDKDQLGHLSRVLRCKSGDIVYFSDNERFSYQTKVLSIDKGKGIFEIEKKNNLEKSLIKKVLFQCILKKNAMEAVIQKAVEIGADRIIPVISSRAVPNISDRESKIIRWQKISDEAAKQCKRQFRALIGEPVKIDSIDIPSFDLFYVPHEGESALKNKEMVQKVSLLESSSSIGILIGPEGGLTDDELSILERKGAIITSLGKNILRAGTASIYFLSIVDFLLKIKKD